MADWELEESDTEDKPCELNPNPPQSHPPQYWLPFDDAQGFGGPWIPVVIPISHGPLEKPPVVPPQYTPEEQERLQLLAEKTALEKDLRSMNKGMRFLPQPQQDALMNVVRHRVHMRNYRAMNPNHSTQRHAPWKRMTIVQANFEKEESRLFGEYKIQQNEKSKRLEELKALLK
jgi:hypothetical protein